MRNICFTHTSHQILLDTLFVLKVKLATFCQFIVVHFDLISNILLCRYASRTLKMKLLTWCWVISLAGPGSELSLSKYFGPISSLHTKLFYNIKRNAFFLSWRRFVVLTAVTSVSEVIVIFLQLMVGVGLHTWCPVALKRFVAFSKTETCKKNNHCLCNV